MNDNQPTGSSSDDPRSDQRTGEVPFRPSGGTVGLCGADPSVEDGNRSRRMGANAS